MKNLKRCFLLLLFAAITTQHSWGQLYEVPLEARIHHAQLIVEGQVVDEKSFIPEGAGNIFTSYLVKVTQTLKGKSDFHYIQILEKGGTIDGKSDWVSHSAPLSVGMNAIFFCRRSGRKGIEFSQKEVLSYELYSGAQGIIILEHSGDVIIGKDAFHQYSDIQGEVYDRINPGVSPKLKHKPSPQYPLQKTQGALSISSFSPQSISGGTRSVLTIRGTDFGATKGTVSFFNADNGGTPMWVPTDPADILSWADTLITCWVPSMGPYGDFFRGVPGTGPLKVVNSSGDSAISSGSLNILFSIRNFRTFSDSTANYYFFLDTNGLGGYTFQYSQSFNNSPDAVKVFEKSLKEWRCNTGVNFVVGNPTAKNVAIRDGTNIVKWNDDSTDSLSAGTLAQTTIRRSTCVDGNTSQTLFFPDEIDMVFKDTGTMFIDTLALPPSDKYDFFTTVLHEIGHAHLLNHVVPDSSLMYYATDTGRSVRNIDADQLDGGNWVIDSSIIGHPYCPSNQPTPKPMIRVSTSNCLIIDGVDESDLGISPEKVLIYPNPTDRDFNVLIYGGDHNYYSVEIEVVDLLGRSSGILQIPSDHFEGNLFRVSSDHLSNGINIVKISINGLTQSTILIKN